MNTTNHRTTFLLFVVRAVNLHTHRGFHAPAPAMRPASVVVALLLGFACAGCSAIADGISPSRELRQRQRRLRGGSGRDSVIEESIVQPVAVLAPPGSCVFDAHWSAVPLVRRERIAHDSVLLTFGLADKGKPLGLSTCACLLVRGGADGKTVRPYTPVSTNAMLGAFQLLVKIYPDGDVSQHLAKMREGETVEFKHIPVNVKIQYPFPAKKVVMLVGGTGVTPMIQALHALLGTRTDTTDITLVYSNKEQRDILERATLEAWAAAHSHRFRITHTLTREPPGSSWAGRRGRVDRSLLQQLLPAPSDDVLIFVCGPPSMYETLSGPRNDKALSGVLAELGYSAKQVVKF